MRRSLIAFVLLAGTTGVGFGGDGRPSPRIDDVVFTSWHDDTIGGDIGGEFEGATLWIAYGDPNLEWLADFLVRDCEFLDSFGDEAWYSCDGLLLVVQTGRDGVSVSTSQFIAEGRPEDPIFFSK